MSMKKNLSALREQLEKSRLEAEIAAYARAANADNLLASVVGMQEDQWGDLVNRREYLSDTPGWGDGQDQRLSQASDRARGKYYPVFENEIDLAAIRGIGRYIAATTEIGANVIENLTSFVIGTGFVYSAVAKYGEEPNESLIAAVEAELARFHETAEWDGQAEAELIARTHTDGEWFAWLRGDGRLLIVEPDYVTEPRDRRAVEEYLDLPGLDWLFGVATEPGHSAARNGYFVQWEGDPTNWDVVPAAEMVHCRANVPRGVKRGYSDFYAAYQRLEQTSKLLGNTLQGGAIQAAIAFIREHVAGTTSAQITGVRAGSAVGTTQFATQNSGVRTVNRERFFPGKVIDTVGTQYKYGPLGQSSAPQFIEIVQAGARMVGARWNMPEYMISGDASNANYSSSLTSGGPFDRSTQRRQSFFKKYFGDIHWAWLRQRANAGAFRSHGVASYEDLRQVVDLNIEAPPPSVQNKLEEEQIRKIRADAGILSRQTWASQAGLEYDVEVANGAAIAAPSGGQWSAGSIGQDAPIDQQAPSLSLSGAQVTAAAGLLAGVADKTVPPPAAMELLVAVGIDRRTASKMIAASAKMPSPSPATISPPADAKTLAESRLLKLVRARAQLFGEYP